MFTIKLRHEERILKGDKEFHEVTEQLYLYRKSNKFKPHKKQYDNTSIDEYIYEVNIIDDKPQTFLMDGKTVTSYNPSQFKIIKREPNENCLKKINIRGTLKEGNSSGRFYMKHFHPLVTENYGHLFSVPDMGDDGIGNRFFLTPKDEKKSNGDYFQGIPQKRSDIKEVPYPNYFDFTDDFNRVGYEGGVDFRFGKKPLEFLKRVFEIAGLQNFPDALILDSFGGSGSTGHAVLKFNKDYIGNRKFILIEMQEYAETITAARIKNAINGYGSLGSPQAEGTGGSFDYYELGPALFNEDNEINELVGVEKLRQYIYYTETKGTLTSLSSAASVMTSSASVTEAKKDNEYLLNKHNDTAYYFYYEQDGVTTLNHDFLSTIKTRAEQYVIYADNCLLTKEFMTKHHIIFKKIPRDITKF
jgi:adenine specific DNA methylase Mod